MQHVAHRAIRWHRVTTWFDGAQPKTSLCVSLEHCPKLHLLPFGVLYIIEAVCTRLPDVYRRSSNRLAHSRLDQGRDKTWLAGYPFGNAGPMGEMRRPVDMERAKHGLFGHTLGPVVILRYYELRQAERIGQQDKFLTLIVALLTNAGNELDTLEPFILGKVHLACKLVQVLDEASRNFLQTRARHLLQPPHDFVRNIVLVQILHRKIPSRVVMRRGLQTSSGAWTPPHGI